MVKYIKLSVTLTVFLSALLLSGFGEGISPARAVDDALAAELPGPLAVCTPATPGMVAYWPLNDPDATPPMTFDDLLNNPPEHPGHPGTCSTAGSCPASTSGKINTAFFFDGNDQVIAPDGDDLDFGIDGSFSIELWVKTSQLCHSGDPAVETRKVFISKYDSSGTSWWVGCSYDDVNLIDVAAFSLRSSAGGEGDLIKGVAAINDDAWHQVVAVREFTGPATGEGVNRLYVDGAEVATLARTYPASFANENSVTFGVHATSYLYNGVLDEVAIYSQALSAADILAHYNTGTGLAYCDEPLRATSPGDQVSTENTAIAPLQIQHTPAGAVVTNYGAAGLPPGLSINTGTGVISGTPTYDANAGSPYAVTATVNTASGSDTTVFTWTVNNVNRAPEITSIPANQSNTEGETITPLQVTATDLDGDTVTFTATNLPPSLIISTSGEISGTIAYNAYETSPSYTVVVTATDNGTPIALTDEGSFTWAITNANFAPDVTPPEDQTDKAGDTVSLQIVAIDPDGDPLTYTATGLPDGLTIGLNSGLISGVLSSSSTGIHLVEVTVSDGFEGNDVTVEFTWTVTAIDNAPPDVTNPGNKTNKERDSVSLQIVATDEDGDDLSYTASGLPDGLSIGLNSGLISGVLSTSSTGVHTVVVTVSDGIDDVSVEFTWAVTNVELVFLPVIGQVKP